MDGRRIPTDDCARMRAATCVALLISFSASAECKKDELNRYLAAAVRLYEALEYERALDQFAKAKDLSCGVDDDAMLGLYEGIVRSDLGEAEKAKSAFKEALLLKPDAELPLKVSPKVKRQVEVLRAEAKKELAPIIARQEEERRKKIAEENAAAQKQRQEDEARRAEESRRVEEARRAADNAKTEEQRRLALEEMRRLDEQRRLDEVRRAEEAARRASEKRVASSDRPEVRELTPAQPVEPEPIQLRRSGVPSKVVIPIVFAGAGLIAGGVGGYFGFTARQGQAAALMRTDNQVEREKLRSAANTSALIADVLFGVAGVAAVGALISLFAVPSEP